MYQKGISSFGVTCSEYCLYCEWVWYTGCVCHSRYCAPMQTLKELKVLLKPHEEAQRKEYGVRMKLEGSLHACHGS